MPDAAVEGTRLQDRAQVQDRGGGHAVRRRDRAPAGLAAWSCAPGYSANADIVVREKTDVLLLPERLVTFARRQGHGRGAARRARASPSKKEIKVGLSDGINIEVAEG